MRVNGNVSGERDEMREEEELWPLCSVGVIERKSGEREEPGSDDPLDE